MTIKMTVKMIPPGAYYSQEISTWLVMMMTMKIRMSRIMRILRIIMIMRMNKVMTMNIIMIMGSDDERHVDVNITLED